MGVKITTVKNFFPQTEKSLKALNGKKVQVGVFGGEQAWLAGIHEYGVNIKVTDKMRKFLNANGLHLKKSTTVIHIPERSFLRSGYDESIDEVIKEAERLLSLQNIDSYKILDNIGRRLAEAIKDYAVELSEPPKHPFTLEMEGNKSNPLVNTGEMINSISYRVE